MDYQSEQYWEGNSYESELTQSLSYQEEYYNYQYFPPVYKDFHRRDQGDSYGYSNQHSNFSQGLNQSQCQIPHQQQEKVSPQDAKMMYQSNEDKQLARIEAMLSEIEGFLSASNLSDQQRIEYLSMKCEILLIKIQIEESISPLSTDITNHSQLEDKVVDIDTTPTPSFAEEPLVEHIFVENEVKEEVTSLLGHEIGCSNLNEDLTLLKEQDTEVIKVISDPPSVLIVTTNKVGDKGSRTNIRKVGLQDIGHVIMKRLRCNNNYSTNMPVIRKHIWTRHVNYRVYVGNSVGKCALRPP